MSACTRYFIKVPVVTYEWREVYAVTSNEVREEHPEALEVLHWTEYDEEYGL